MTTRTAFSNLSNNDIRPSVAGKRTTRATAMVSLAMKNAPKVKGKENIIAGLKDNSKVVRPTRIAARRLSKVKSVEIQDDQPMDIEATPTIALKSEGVVDIDAADSANPQLCAEYAQEIYKYWQGAPSQGR